MKKLCCLFLSALFLLAAVLTGCGEVSPVSQEAEEETVLQPAEEAAPPVESVTPVDSGFCYARSCLTAEQQTLYDQLAAGIAAHTPEIGELLPDKDVIFSVARAVCWDHPDYFWFDGGGEVETTFQGEAPISAVYRPGYTMDSAEQAACQETIDQWTAACCATIPADASDYERVLAVYRYIIANTEYRDVDSNSIVNVMVKGYGKCGCYAMTTQYLLNRVGVDCAYISGTARGESHAWNLVWLDGNPCWLDTTWGDPVFEGENPLIGTGYDYFCITTADLLRTHTIDSRFTVPDCTCEDYNYYRRNGLYFEEYRWKDLIAPVEQAVSNGEKQIAFRFSDDAFETAAEGLFSEKDLGRLFRAVDRKMKTDFSKAEQFQCASDKEMGSITILFPS